MWDTLAGEPFTDGGKGPRTDDGNAAQKDQRAELIRKTPARATIA